MRQGKGRISAATRRRVTEATEEIDYVYNRSIADLRRRHSVLIGFVLHDIANPSYAELIAGLEPRLI